MQFDIIDGQVWIQHNSTEIYVDRELIQRGVASQDIIFGFRSPTLRKLLMELSPRPNPNNTVYGFPWKAKKFNGKVRREAPHFTALS